MYVGSRLDAVRACFRRMEKALQTKGRIVCVLDPTLSQDAFPESRLRARPGRSGGSVICFQANIGGDVH